MPLAAAENPYLMHGIMAFSALHLAFLHPNEQKWKVLALKHQNTAMALLRSALPSMNADNAHAITALSVLLCASSVSPSRPTFAPSLSGGKELDDVVEAFMLIRVIGRVFYSYKSLIEQSSMAQIFDVWTANSPHFSLHTIEEDQFGLLYALINCDASTSESVSASLGGAINALQRVHKEAISCRDQAYSTLRTVWRWPLRTDETYVSLLHQKHPVALVILAHFTVLSDVVDGPWFLSGWAAGALNSISHSLPDEWQHWLDWPKETLNLQPRNEEIERAPNWMDDLL
jgi:hypothetical protein